MSKTIFCPECREDVTFSVKDSDLTMPLKGEEYQIKGMVAYCDKCGAEIYVAEIEDYNLEQLYNEYRKANDIISLEQIRAIPEKYAIAKRPLSLLLGWGEQTFTRYYNGDMPSKLYSDTLKRLYAEPMFYHELLTQNKDKLNSPMVYEKSKAAVQKLIGIDNSSKLNLVAAYLLKQCEDVTHLALQKMLYYTQGFYYAFSKQFMFDEDCEAWVHGPVYREIYNKYSDYKYGTIDEVLEIDNGYFSTLEKAVMDSVVDSFGRYSGKVLERLTHSESPWLTTRAELQQNELSNRIIEKRLIAECFTAVKNKYEMLSPADISNYANSMIAKNYYNISPF